jgi:hypothetical protein
MPSLASLAYRAAEKYQDIMRIWTLLEPTREELIKVLPEVKQLVKEVRLHLFPELFQQEIATRDYIRQIQDKLKNRGYDIDVDGVLGEQTFDAFIEFCNNSRR